MYTYIFNSEFKNYMKWVLWSQFNRQKPSVHIDKTMALAETNWHTKRQCQCICQVPNGQKARPFLFLFRNMPWDENFFCHSLCWTCFRLSWRIRSTGIYIKRFSGKLDLYKELSISLTESSFKWGYCHNNKNSIFLLLNSISLSEGKTYFLIYVFLFCLS